MLETKLGIHIFFVLCGEWSSTIPWCVAFLFEDKLCIFNWLANIKQLKLIKHYIYETSACPTVCLNHSGPVWQYNNASL